MLRKFFLFLFISLLASCASPSLKKQEVSQSAIDREEEIQKQLAQAQLNELKERLEAVELKLAPQVRELCDYLSGDDRGDCYFPVEIEDSPTLNAYTDGEKVVFYSGIIKLLDKEEELAVVLGHEYAHAMLLHINKRKTNMFIGLLVDVLLSGATGVSTEGAFSEIGSKAYSKDFELEADYAGLYLAHRAGYDISQAANVWRKMAIETGSASAKKYSSTHPSSPKRFIAQEHTYSEIIQKEIDGKPLLPDKLEMVEQSDAVASNKESSTDSKESPPAETERSISITEPEQKRVIGDYSIAAEDFAESLGCQSDDGGIVVGNMINEEYGIETYEFNCASAHLTVECEFGNCVKL